MRMTGMGVRFFGCIAPPLSTQELANSTDDDLWRQTMQAQEPGQPSEDQGKVQNLSASYTSVCRLKQVSG